jgi:hypothetical protein
LSRINQNGNNKSLNNTAQSLGDYISLSNNASSTQKKFDKKNSISIYYHFNFINRIPSSPEADVILSSSDENEDDFLTEYNPIFAFY